MSSIKFLAGEMDNLTDRINHLASRIANLDDKAEGEKPAALYEQAKQLGESLVFLTDQCTVHNERLGDHEGRIRKHASLLEDKVLGKDLVDRDLLDREITRAMGRLADGMTKRIQRIASDAAMVSEAMDRTWERIGEIEKRGRDRLGSLFHALTGRRV